MSTSCAAPVWAQAGPRREFRGVRGRVSDAGRKMIFGMIYHMIDTGSPIMYLARNI